MAEVGVLNLTIHDNSSTAAQGLEELTGALTNLQQIVSNGLKLSGISRTLNTFANAVSSNSKTLSNIGTFLNAVREYNKAFKDLEGVKFNKQPITDLKDAIGDGIRLGQAGTQLKNLRDAINGDWNSENATVASTVLQTIAEGSKAIGASSLSTTAKNIGNLAKSLGDYADSISKVSNTPGAHDYLSMQVFAPAEESKTTGANIGYGVQEGMESTMSAVEQAAKAIADAVITTINERLDEHSPSRVTKQSGKYAGVGLAEGLDESAGDVKRAALAIAGIVAESMKTANVGDYLPNQIRQAALDVKYYGSALDAVLPKVQAMSSAEMIAAENARYAAMSERERKVFLAELNGELKTSHVKEIEPEFQTVSSQISTMKIELQEIGDVVTSVIVPAFQEMYQTWSLMAYQFGMFQSHMARLTAGDSPLLLGNGKTPGQLLLGDGTEQETFLSTWVRTGEQWKQNWVYFASEAAEEMRAYFQPDWIMGGQSVPQSMATFHLGAGPAQLLLGDGGVSPDNMLSTFVDETEQWKQNWIIGEGTVSETAEEASKVVAATYAAAKAAEMTEARFQQILEDKREEAELAEQIRQKQLDKFYEEKQPLSLEQTNEMADNITQLDLLKAKLGEAEAKYNDYVNTLGAGAVKTLQAGLAVQDLRDKIWEYRQALAGVTEEQESAEGTAITLSSAWSFLKTTMKKMFPTLTSLLGRFGQIVKYRMLRSVLRYITSGFSEGVKNLYQYSKAVGTDFAPAMDDAASTLLKLKNSIGASVAPLIQTLVPVLQTVVNWVVQAINFLNQMFALLRGQTTWTKAVDTATEAYKNNTKEAKNASKAAKDMLADWDELNIIQSNSGGGGGGAGTGNDTDYSSMFEEVNKFSDSVKNAINFIEEHLGGLASLFKKLGVLLLGWKFSKAFTGFLGMLGKLIAGGALVVLGVEFSFGAGFSAGSKGYWDTADILTAIGGTLATAIGGSLITTALGFGGAVGFTIGLGVGLVALISGYIQGQADFADKMKWGSEEWTPEQIQEYIRSRFSFNVDAEIELLDTNIKNRQEAEANLTKTVNDFTSSLTFAKMKVGVKANDAPLAVAAACVSAQKVIDEIQSYIDKNEKALTTTLSISPMKDAEGNDITSDILSQVSFADTTLKEYFIGLGKELADAVYQGEKDGWTEGEMEAALALMEHQRNIVAKAEEYERDLTFDADIKMNLRGLTRDNAKEIIEQEQKIIEEYKQKFMQDRESAKQAAIKELAWTEAAIEDYKSKGLDTTDLETAAETYRTLIDDYLNPEKAEEAWKLKLAESTANMRQDWIEALSGVYGITGNVEFKENRSPTFMYKSTENVLTNDIIDAMKSKDPVGEATKALKEYFDTVKKLQPEYIQDLMDSLNLNVWDFADKNVKQSLTDMLRQNLGDDYAKIVLQNAGAAKEEIEEFFKTPIEFKPQGWENPMEGILNTFGLGGLSYKPPELEVPVNVTLDPQVEEDELFNKLQAALRDNVFSDVERKALEFRYGKEALEKMLETLGVKFGEDGVVLNPYGWGKGSAQPKMVGVVGAAGTSTDYGGFYRGGYSNNNQEEEQPAETDFVVDVSGLDPSSDTFMTGMTNSLKTANGDVVSELRTMVVQLQRLLNKQWTVQVQPSTAWGNNNYYSNQKRGKVTGEVE